jgi:hypothetical protein
MRRTKLRLVVVLVSLTILCVAGLRFAKSQSTETLINVNPDGSIDPLTAPIQRNGNVYTLNGNISGSIAIHKSNIVIDGAGYTLQGYGGTGIDLKNHVTEVPSSREIWNVTVRNLRIMNFNFSIDTDGGGNHTFTYDYIANTTNDVRGGIFLWSCSGNNITHCTIIGEPAIYMHFVSSQNTITENNLSGDLSVLIGGDETVDRNYWTDYVAKYPNASEIDSTGVGNTPNMFNSSGLVSGVLQDNHPLMNPIAILDFPTLLTSSMPAQGLPSPSLTPSVPEFPSRIILILIIMITTSMGLLIKEKRKRHDSWI